MKQIKKEKINKKGGKKRKWLVPVLVILLIIAVSYIALVKYNAWKQEKDLGIFQQGAQYGYEQAVIQIAGMAVSCEQVPLRIENQTINMIAVECLQQG